MFCKGQSMPAECDPAKKFRVFLLSKAGSLLLVAEEIKSLVKSVEHRWLVTEFIRLVVFTVLGCKHTCCNPDLLGHDGEPDFDIPFDRSGVSSEAEDKFGIPVSNQESTWTGEGYTDGLLESEDNREGRPAISGNRACCTNGNTEDSIPTRREHQKRLAAMVETLVDQFDKMWDGTQYTTVEFLKDVLIAQLKPIMKSMEREDIERFGRGRRSIGVKMRFAECDDDWDQAWEKDWENEWER
ncbi:hypothetical protein M011DRAFT_489321 [Sporormia fimetaria CBS 119925]|uniref:Uncharacterized protein n=1 Tax=Sporormia fimetaria CBS 119925 TaxID=1340428 RepID=A0A6A6V0E2_9PLEO|nr:hypothetical protein M011DRAFT_489321 [Sporormia fimetaria CBS 119925]